MKERGKKVIVIFLDFAALIYFLAGAAVFFTGGFQFFIGTIHIRMTSLRNIIYPLFLIMVLKLWLDENWVITKDAEGVRLKIKKFFSFTGRRKSRLPGGHV